MTGTAWMQDILALELDARTKGIPLAAERVRLGDVGKQGWNVLRGDLMFPVLALRDVRMRQNLQVLRDFARHHQVDLAPHGKSTMCPQLYQDQIEVGGAWGITAATVQQCAVVAAAGVPNIIIANEVVGRANLAQLAGLKRAYPRAASTASSIRWRSSSSSSATADRRSPRGRASRCCWSWATRAGGPAPGPWSGRSTCSRPSGRIATSWSSPGSSATRARSTSRGPTRRSWRSTASSTSCWPCSTARGSSTPSRGRAEVLLTAGGSSYFDRVAAKFTPARRGPATRVVLRGGSYLTYDDGFYRKKMSELQHRGGIATASGRLDPTVALQPALELWALVQALQDPGVAILTMGIRDLPYDLGYPFPLRQYRDGTLLGEVADGGFEIVNSNDQHCYLRYPAGADIRIGDCFVFGISHPCTAFDKWDVLYRVDEEFNVIGALKTFF